MPSVRCSTHSTTGVTNGCEFGEQPVTDDDPFEDLDVPADPFEDLDRATRHLTLRTEERRYGKQMVIIEGFAALQSALGFGGPSSPLTTAIS